MAGRHGNSVYGARGMRVDATVDVGRGAVRGSCEGWPGPELVGRCAASGFIGPHTTGLDMEAAAALTERSEGKREVHGTCHLV